MFLLSDTIVILTCKSPHACTLFELQCEIDGAVTRRSYGIVCRGVACVTGRKWFTYLGMLNLMLHR